MQTGIDVSVSQRSALVCAAGALTLLRGAESDWDSNEGGSSVSMPLLPNDSRLRMAVTGGCQPEHAADVRTTASESQVVRRYRQTNCADGENVGTRMAQTGPESGCFAFELPAETLENDSQQMHCRQKPPIATRYMRAHHPWPSWAERTSTRVGRQ